MEEEQKRKHGRRTAIICLILACAAVAAIAWGLWAGGGRPPLDENAVPYQMPDGQVNADPQQFAFPVFDTLHMEGGTGKVRASFLNMEGNPGYFIYHVILSGTGEEIYQSGLIEPGKAVKEFTAEKDLEPGRYEIQIEIETRQLDDHTVPMNSGVITAVLEVAE